MPAPNFNTLLNDTGGGGNNNWWSPVKTTPMPKPRITTPITPPIQEYFDQIGDWWNGVFNQPKPKRELFYDPNEDGQLGVRVTEPTPVPKTPFPNTGFFDLFSGPTISQTLNEQYPPVSEPKKQWYTDSNGQLRLGIPSAYDYFTPIPPWSGVPDNWQTRQAQMASQNPEYAPRYVPEEREKNTPQDYFDRIVINGRTYSVPNQMLNFTDTGGVWPWEPTPSWYEPPRGMSDFGNNWKEWRTGETVKTDDSPPGDNPDWGGGGYGWGGGYGSSNYSSKPAYPTQGYKQDPNIYYQQLVKWVI